jgi:predicted nucleic acid-binding protein
LKGGGLPEEQPEASDEDASLEQDPLCILDAVICVHFVGANLQNLLIDVLRRAQLVLMVPEEVSNEISGKEHKYPGIRTRWLRLAQSRHIQVLPILEAGSAPRKVVEVFEEVRQRHFEEAHRDPKDLGEAVVVAHGVHFHELGRDVILAIDDQGGQAIAAARGLTVMTIEDVLELAIGFNKFDTEGELKATYGRLRQYGDGLPHYSATLLSTLYKESQTSGDA